MAVKPKSADKYVGGLKSRFEYVESKTRGIV